MATLTVSKTIEIDAPAAKVWNILVTPDLIKQWDDVPEDFNEPVLKMGSELIWKQENGKTVTMKVVTFAPPNHLRELWYVSTLEKPADFYDIGYDFILTETGGKTRLEIRVGDWGKLPDGKDYYDASVEFADTAGDAIKKLAET